jgi:hypothetical protein
MVETIKTAGDGREKKPNISWLNKSLRVTKPYIGELPNVDYGSTDCVPNLIDAVS